MIRFLVAAILIIVPLIADDPFTLKAPSSAAVYDQAHRVIRPVVGLPGASILGTPIGDVDAVSVSTEGGRVLVLQAGTWHLVASDDVPDSSKWRAVGSGNSDDLIAWAPDGSTAIYSHRTGAVTIADPKGKTQHTHRTNDLQRTSTYAIALGSGGRLVLALDVDNSTHLMLIASGHETLLTRLAAKSRALRWTSSGIFVLDGSEPVVWHIDPDRHQMTLLCRVPEDIKPSEMIVSHDGTSVVLVDFLASRFYRFQRSTGEVLEQKLSLKLDANTTFRPAGRDIWAISGPTAGTLVQLIRLSGRLETYFVPDSGGY
jgi:hypothetical protein